MDRLVVVIYFTQTLQIDGFSCYKEKQWLSFSIHKVIWTCLGSRFFRTRCISLVHGPDYLSLSSLIAECCLYDPLGGHQKTTTVIRSAVNIDCHSELFPVRRIASLLISASKSLHAGLTKKTLTTDNSDRVNLLYDAFKDQ